MFFLQKNAKIGLFLRAVSKKWLELSKNLFRPVFGVFFCFFGKNKADCHAGQSADLRIKKSKEIQYWGNNQRHKHRRRHIGGFDPRDSEKIGSYKDYYKRACNGKIVN